MAMSSNEMRRLVPRALREARSRAELAPEEVAFKANISPQALTKHESGSNLPQLDVFLKELEALGLDFGAFHDLLIELRGQEKIDELASRIAHVERQLESEDTR